MSALYGSGLWRGYAAVVGGVIVVAIWTTDWGGSTIIARSVVSARSGRADRSSTDRGSTDANRHTRSYATVIATTVNAATIDTTTIDATARDSGAIC